ncbi:hypothetical protein BJY01DRAFT_252983 [Aspergillus pseudoustus]|uniref:F-box domain-containing protein n=1 Tax=Aspergillus pseudoustus TaxID=1810923 RepID=A0ABR4J543_9EURO
MSHKADTKPLPNAKVTSNNSTGKSVSVKSIIDLPTEIIDQIVALAVNEGQGPTLRLTCKYLNEISTRHWARVAFGDWTTDFSAQSLNTLEQIANHKQLAPHVKRLYIGGNITDHDLGKHIAWEQDAQGHVKFQQPAVQRIKRILQKFENVRDIQINQRGAVFTGAGLPGAFWLGEALGILFRTLADLKREVDVLGLARRAYGTRPWQDLPGLTATVLEEVGARGLWSHLRVFSLRSSEPPWTMPAKVCEHAPRLRELELSFNGGPSGQLLMNRLFGVRIPFQLEVLNLRGVPAVHDDQLMAFLAPHARTLRDLNLTDMRSEENRSWVRILQRIAREFSALQAFKFASLAEGLPPDSRVVRFPGLAANPVVDAVRGLQFDLVHSCRLHGPGGDSVEWSGEGADLALQKLVDFAVLDF